MLLFHIKDLFAPVFVRDGLLDAPHSTPFLVRSAGLIAYLSTSDHSFAPQKMVIIMQRTSKPAWIYRRLFKQLIYFLQKSA
jgi:hypothetical protein